MGLQWKGVALLGCILILLCIVQAQTEEPRRRYDYKRSLKKPFFVGDTLPHFKILGDVLPSQDYLRLTPSVQSMKGAIWSELAVPYEQWQAIFTFSITGRGRLGGDGLAFWYTSQSQPLGKAMGSNEVFDGFMLGFDTYDNDGKRDNPTIFGVLNDGSSTFDPETDAANILFASCSIGFRNNPVPTWVRVTNAHGHLKVEVDVNGRGKSPTVCFDQADVSLPSGYFLGFSSATGGLADDHDLISLEFFEIDPPIKAAQPPTQPLANQEQFEKIQEQVQEMRAKNEIPFEVDETYKSFLGKLSSLDDLLAELSFLSNSQRQVQQLLETTSRNIENLSRQISNIGGSSPPSASTTQQVQHPISKQDFDMILNRINDIQNDIRANTQGNQGSNLESFIRQTNDRLQRMENSQLSMTQMIRDEINKIRLTSPQSNSSYSDSSSSGDYTFALAMIGVLVMLGIIIFGAVRFLTKNNNKKFV